MVSSPRRSPCLLCISDKDHSGGDNDSSGVYGTASWGWSFFSIERAIEKSVCNNPGKLNGLSAS